MPRVRPPPKTAGLFGPSPKRPQTGLFGDAIYDYRLPDGSTPRKNAQALDDYATDVARYSDPATGGLAAFGNWVASVSPHGRWGTRLGEPGGNRNYGVTGRRLGLPLGFLQWAAGLAEMTEPIIGKAGTGISRGTPFTGPPWGDDQAAQDQIAAGYNALPPRR